MFCIAVKYTAFHCDILFRSGFSVHELSLLQLLFFYYSYSEYRWIVNVCMFFELKMSNSLIQQANNICHDAINL